MLTFNASLYKNIEGSILILQTRNNAGGIRLAATLEPSNFFRPLWTLMFRTIWIYRGLTKWSAVFQGQVFGPHQDTAFFCFVFLIDPGLKDVVVIMCFWLECAERHLYKVSIINNAYETWVMAIRLKQIISELAWATGTKTSDLSGHHWAHWWVPDTLLSFLLTHCVPLTACVLSINMVNNRHEGCPCLSDVQHAKMSTTCQLWSASIAFQEATFVVLSWGTFLALRKGNALSFGYEK